VLFYVETAHAFRKTARTRLSILDFGLRIWDLEIFKSAIPNPKSQIEGRITGIQIINRFN
jgi:hypothetical protein